MAIMAGLPWWIYVGATTAVVFLFVYRVVASIAARSGGRAAAPD